MIRALVFDMDGVIIDSEPIHTEILLQMLRNLAVGFNYNMADEFIGVTEKQMWSVLRERYHIEKTVEQLLEENRSHKQNWFMNEKLVPVDGIPELVKSAKSKGFSIALATSSPRNFAELVLESVGIAPYFDALVTADDISRSKPDPEIYLKAAKTLGFKPNECVAIEDAFLGIQSAKGAGFKCIAFSNPNSGNQDTTQADFVVSSIRDIDLNGLDNL